jgi:murein DD-endopeptidase MepM/ murein hydrolase activator NlpD
MRVEFRAVWLGAVAGIAAGALLAAACGDDADAGLDVTPSTATASPTATSTPELTATATPEALVPDPEDPRGFAYPVAGACLPDSDRLMPNAPREYRNGIHEGVDFYPGLACADVALGTPAMAMFDGVVIRADLAYQDITPDQVNELAARTAAQGFTDDETLDIYRGRQVWIDHGNGVVTRYCHLSGIADGIELGAAVKQGDVVGYVGESGTPESVTAPGTELHLHAEVRIGDSFLGAGLPPAEVRALYERLFAPADDDEAGAAY